MAKGTLEVLLIGAKGLENSDFLSGVDPYAVITYRTQEKKSSVASGEGSNPEWNETFLFTVSHGVSEIRIKFMDKDTFTQDDFVGETIITLDQLFVEGNIPPTSYNIIKDETYCGEVRIGLSFTPQADRGCNEEEDDIGGWKESATY